MNRGFNKRQLALAVAATISASAIAALPAAASPGKTDTYVSGGFNNDKHKPSPRPSGPKQSGTYVAGDFHNHSTCSDGSISMQKLIRKSTDTRDTPWGLDWFVQAGHGGNGNRNCTLAEDETLATPAFPLVRSGDGTVQGPNTTWLNTNVAPAVEIKGSVTGSGNDRRMWRWQSLQEFQYPITEYLASYLGKPLFLGMESVVAGHEHTSMSVISGQMPAALGDQPLPLMGGAQYTALGNADALSMWSYCFDRGDTDTSRGNKTGTSEGNNWDCSVPGSANSLDASWNATAMKLMPASGTGAGDRGHNKTLEALKWMVEFHPEGSYYVPAHLERAGPFNPNGNNGFNVEHLRNFNNVAPRVAFGFETQPGHGASDARGEYNVLRNNFGGTAGYVDSVGGTTYGGTGVYGAQVGGVWDALLGEGRNWWFFASSDWHNRGSFGPDDRRTTQDFYPGEYQRNYTMVDGADGTLTPQAIVDGLRSGNVFTDSGQLVDRVSFVACIGNPRKHGRSAQAVESLAINAARGNTDLDKQGCATMGQKLEVPKGADVIVSIVVRDPAGKSHSPYTFANPSLAQVGIVQPLDEPVLDHIDVIAGAVTGYRTPGAADYAGEWPRSWLNDVVAGTATLDSVPAAAKNTSAEVIRTFTDATWTAVRRDPEFKAMTFRIPKARASQYVRLRGTNLPASVPFETDADGNPLPDLWTNAVSVRSGIPENGNLRIPCNSVGTTEFDGCPSHLGNVDGQKYVSYDVAAWADLWFYSNPIFIEVTGSFEVAGVE